ncbi:MFS transporter [Nonomuraea aurantiaca]|uniref:MFS transporter n=1 Tax=Nonomuraea aurantiaca TaxID=2878562 RepID=UPI001CD9D5A0|nr:MFS transporter [Nonomuraea aurantiaca]MCA2220753.1 MFS transporter [Nonomuraea aurantiaca]
MSKGLGRDFNLLWAGQTVSNLGDRVTLFVIPTVLVFLLGASAFEVGLISTAQYLAIPVLSLAAGALADRWDLRRMLIACDLVRFAAIVIIPIAYWQGFLSVPLLFVCVAVISAATVFFNIGYMPAIAATVESRELVRGNSRMEASRTASELGGPAIAGGLYQVLGVAALLVDAVSFLFSAAAIRSMRPFGERTAERRRILSRAMAGVRMNWMDPILRRSTAGTLLANIGGPIFVTQMPVLAYQGLHLSAGLFGTVMSVAAVGAVLGALVAPKVSGRVGSGRMLAISMVAHSLSGLGLLAVPTFPPAIVLALTLASYGFFFAWYNINSAAVRQARVPIGDQAVIHGAYRTVTWGVIPISTLAGGWAVSSLTAQLGVLDAAKLTMLAATLVGVLSLVPLAGMQRLLTIAPPMAEPSGRPS